jgi:hypothetical protein
MTTKIHYHSYEAEYDYLTPCGRDIADGIRASDVAANVTCGLCRKSPAYLKAKAEADAREQAEFEAQTPHTVSPSFARLNSDGVLECRNLLGPESTCSSVLFRYQGRSCMGHYDDYVCAACGHTTSTLTETGMCF